MNSKMKRVLALGMSVAMMATLCVAPSVTASAAKAKANVTLTLWGSQSDQAILKTMTENFKKQFKDNNYTIKLGVQGEDTARTTVLRDLDAAADVFGYASDQTSALVSAGALAPVTIDTAKIKSANVSSSISSCTIGKYLYAYPYTSNSFFLYYDKSKLSATDVKSLETIMAKKTSTGVSNFAMNMTTGWYGASFFLTAGCTLFGSSGTVATQCSFNNQKGLVAGNYMINLAKNSKFVDYTSNYDSQIIQNFKQKKIASAVSGTWNSDAIKTALGSNYAAVKLPTIKLNGKATQMKAFASYKVYGVNSHSKNMKAAMELAEFLSNYDNQKLRFKSLAYAPTNRLLAANKTDLASQPAAAALAAQISVGAVLQPSINQMSNFWTPMGSFGSQCETKKTTTKTLQSDLNTMVKSILAKIS